MLLQSQTHTPAYSEFVYEKSLKGKRFQVSNPIKTNEATCATFKKTKKRLKIKFFFLNFV